MTIMKIVVLKRVTKMEKLLFKRKKNIKKKNVTKTKPSPPKNKRKKLKAS